MSRSACSFARLSNGIRLAYVERGRRDGPVVVMLHGITDSHRSYELLQPHLPEAWRVIAITQRGHGRSAKPDVGYETRDLAADVCAFLDALGVERPIVVGHSMGAAVALQFAADFSNRVAGLVLMGAFAGFAGNPAVAAFERAISGFEEKVDPWFVLDFQSSTFAELIPQSFLDIVVGESLRCPGFVWRAALQGLLNADVIAAAAKCHTPALLLRGDKDAFVPREDQLLLRDALSSARMVTMQGVGHAPHWERPQETAALLQAFLGELADAGGLPGRE